MPRIWPSIRFRRLIKSLYSFWEKNVIQKDTYLPFGMGERICIGQGFAMQEAVLILANILRNYQLKLQENFVPDVVGRLTIRSANGMQIQFTQRKN